MRYRVSILPAAEIRVDELCLIDIKSQVFNCDIQKLAHRVMCVGKRLIEPTSLDDNVISTRSNIVNIPVFGVSVNIVCM